MSASPPEPSEIDNDPSVSVLLAPTFALAIEPLPESVKLSPLTRLDRVNSDY